MKAFVKQRSNLYLAAILALSVVLRVAVALYLGDEVDAPPLLTDQRSYHALGARLIAGHGFSFDRPWYPFTPAETPTAHWSFLYSLFVAGVYALLGVHPLAVRVVQGVLGGLLLPWAVWRLARRAFGLFAHKSRDASAGTEALSYAASSYEGGEEAAERLSLVVAAAAAAIAAAYAYFVLYAATLMTETFYIVALLWSLEVGLALGDRLRRGERVSLSLAFQLGSSLGLAALLRQSILPWVPVLFSWLLWQAWRGQRWTAVVRPGIVTGLLLLACIVPWTVRNYVVYGEFLLLNSNAGYAMYSAQHPMHGTQFREFDAAPLPEDLPWGNEALLDRALMRAGIGFMLDDPGRYLLLSLSRIRAFFEFWPTPDTTLLHNVGRTGSFGLFLPFLLYGLVLALRSPRFLKPNGLLFLFAAFYTLLHLLTWAMVRYRLAVDAALMPLTAWGMVDLIQRVRAAIRRRIDRPGTGASAWRGLHCGRATPGCLPGEIADDGRADGSLSP